MIGQSEKTLKMSDPSAEPKQITGDERAVLSHVGQDRPSVLSRKFLAGRWCG